MQYESEAQIIEMRLFSTTENFPKIPDVKKKRRNLLILLSIQLVLTLIYFIKLLTSIRKYSISSRKDSDISLMDSPINNIIILCIFKGHIIVHIIAVIRNSRIGILVFAWLSLTGLIIGFVLLVINIIVLFVDNIGIFGILVVVFILGVYAVMQVLIIKLSFNLAKLLKALKTYQMPENSTI